jgi:hypothetical protein
MRPLIKEIWDLAMSPGVLPFSLLLGPMALFWITCFIGTLDLDFIGVDFGDGGADSGDGGTLFGGSIRWLFKFIHGDVVPLPALGSFLLVYEWGSVMLGNHYWNPDEDLKQAGVIAVWSLIPAFILTKMTGAMLRPMFYALKGTEGEAKPVIGRKGRVRSKTLDESSGQIEVEDPEVPLLLNARLAPGTEALSRGDLVVVESHDKERDVYFVNHLTNTES